MASAPRSAGSTEETTMRVRAGLPATARPGPPAGSLMRPRHARAPRRTEGERTQEGLDPAQEVGLCRRWRSSHDRAALAQLVEAHLGLVQRIANEFRNT